MAFSKKPNYSNSRINKAGDTIRQQGINGTSSPEALEVINRWRISHEYPMHTFNVTLRRKAKAIYPDAIIACRLKRLSTIIDKISNREKSMSLNRMQDIGVVRAIMRDVSQTQQLRDIHRAWSFFAQITVRA